MRYQNIKILLIASEAAYSRGELSKENYLKIISDIKNDLIKSDKELLSEDVGEIILAYASS